MKVIDLGTLSAAASGTAVDLRDQVTPFIQGRSFVLVLCPSQFANLTVELEEADVDAAGSVGAYSDVANTQSAINTTADAAAAVAPLMINVTLNEPMVRLTVSSFTAGDVKGYLLADN